MIADTTFLSDLLREVRRGQRGPASEFFQHHRAQPIRATIISVAEIAVLFETSNDAWQ